jgi:hypothetical protein
VSSSDGFNVYKVYASSRETKTGQDSQISRLFNAQERSGLEILLLSDLAVLVSLSDPHSGDFDLITSIETPSAFQDDIISILTSPASIETCISMMNAFRVAKASGDRDSKVIQP